MCNSPLGTQTGPSSGLYVHWRLCEPLTIGVFSALFSYTAYSAFVSRNRPHGSGDLRSPEPPRPGRSTRQRRPLAGVARTWTSKGWATKNHWLVEENRLVPPPISMIETLNAVFLRILLALRATRFHLETWRQDWRQGTFRIAGPPREMLGHPRTCPTTLSLPVRLQDFSTSDRSEPVFQSGAPPCRASEGPTAPIG